MDESAALAVSHKAERKNEKKEWSVIDLVGLAKPWLKGVNES